MNGALLLSLVVWSSVAAGQIPVLQAAPASLAFVVDGRGQPAPQQIRIRNAGTGTLRWSARADAPWIRVSPASGSGAAEVSVEVDAGRLAPGRHEGRLTIDAPDADDSPITVAVLADVAAGPPPGSPAGAIPPVAAEAPAAPGPAGKPAPPPPAAAAPPGPLRVERQILPPATRNLPYAQAIPVTGGTPPYAIRIVEGRLPAGLVLAQGSISGTARVQGYYPFVVAVTDASAPPASIAQPLGLRVIILQPDTALVVSPPAISLRLQGRSRDGRAALSVSSGRQRLEWTATADAEWLRLDPAAGVSPATVEIVALAGRLTPGTHVATVTVTMEGAPNGLASIPVHVTVPR